MDFENDVRVVKHFAEIEGYKYFLTRESRDFANLLDSGFEGFYLFQAQGTMTPNIPQDGFNLSEVYTGQIFVCKPSNLDGVLITEDGQTDKFDAVEKALALKPYYWLTVIPCPLDAIITTSNVRPFYNLIGINYDGIVFDYRIEFRNITKKLNTAERRNIIENG